MYEAFLSKQVESLESLNFKTETLILTALTRTAGKLVWMVIG